MPDDMLLVQLRMTSEPRTLAAAAARLGVAPQDCDPEFGLVEIDPADHLFAVRVAASKEDVVRGALSGDDPAEGVFGDPRIEPF